MSGAVSCKARGTATSEGFAADFMRTKAADSAEKGGNQRNSNKVWIPNEQNKCMYVETCFFLFFGMEKNSKIFPQCF